MSRKNKSNNKSTIANKNHNEISFDEFMKLIEKTEKFQNAKEELENFNIYKEYNALEGKTNKTIANKGMHCLCKYLITCVENDPINGDYYCDENKNLIIEAGKYFYEYDGVSMMHDVLMSWVPKRYRNEIAYMWNGIGEWEY